MVGKYSESALSLDDHPYDPAEQFVFIEGYAHAGQWERAVDLSIKAHDFSGEITGPMLCKLWRRIAAETVPSLEGSAALSQMQTLFGCNS